MNERQRNMNTEALKADVAIAKERAAGALDITLIFVIDGRQERTELLPNETASTAFPDGFEKFVGVESDKERWSGLSEILGFQK